MDRDARDRKIPGVLLFGVRERRIWWRASMAKRLPKKHLAVIFCIQPAQVTENDMRSLFLHTTILLALLTAGRANAEFSSENCEKVYMAYTTLLIKYGIIESLRRDLNNDLRDAVKQVSETAGATAAIEAIQKKYENRLQLVQADMKEINEGNVALKALCLKK